MAEQLADSQVKARIKIVGAPWTASRNFVYFIGIYMYICIIAYIRQIGERNLVWIMLFYI